tara:strand:+ start:1752 stop:2147 length:396 start_codon:yes stop_codon:yes gene_type:complete
LKSPDGRHDAVLITVGEIRFGPVYCELKIDGIAQINRIFGEELKWSPDSRFLAVEEWLTTDYVSGPITRAAIFDLEAHRCTALKPAERGFCRDFHFEEKTFVYKKNFKGRGEIIELEVDLGSVSGWSRFNS